MGPDVARVSFRRLMTGMIAVLLLLSAQLGAAESRSIHIASIDGTINPATADYLRSSLRRAEAANAPLLIIKLNTPGGLLPSMRTMVEDMLEAKVPVVVFVSPQGGGALSAGVFITMAAHVAVMAPGTQIGAAHPVIGTGNDIQGDMRQKIENSSVSLIKAIAEQRGRNAVWGEQAVRESVSLTDTEAVQAKVVDFIAADIERLIEQLEGRTITFRGEPRTFEGLQRLPREVVDMSFKQSVVNTLADPNIAVLLGLGVVIGFGLELFHPGAILPGVVGFVCLVLSLVAGQVLPISQGGVALLVLGSALFVAEMFIPSFGICGIGGVICIVLGAIYFVDPSDVWSASGFDVNRIALGIVATLCGTLLFFIAGSVVRTRGQKVVTGREGLVDRLVTVIVPFERTSTGEMRGRVRVMGELWHAVLPADDGELPQTGDHLHVASVTEGMTLIVKR